MQQTHPSSTELSSPLARIQQYKRRLKTQSSSNYSFPYQRHKLSKLSREISQQASDRFHKISSMLSSRANPQHPTPNPQHPHPKRTKLPSLPLRYHLSKPTPLTSKQKLIQKLQKRLSYGQRASNLYPHLPPSTHHHPSRYDQSIQKFSQQEHEKYLRILSTLKKKQVTFIEKPYVEQGRLEIEKIKRGRGSLAEKWRELGRVWWGYERKDRYGMEGALELETRAGLAMAELYLEQAGRQ